MPLSARTRRLANLLNLSTPLGLAIARVGRAAVFPGPGGLRLAEGYRLGFPTAVAFTVGDVLITRHRWADLRERRPRLLEHEEVHSHQYAWGGLFFLPAYGVAMAWSWLRTRDRAAGNVFERRAGLSAGGYPDAPRLRSGSRPPHQESGD